MKLALTHTLVASLVASALPLAAQEKAETGALPAREWQPIYPGVQN